MKNHFFFPYTGNKREEVDKIYNVVKENIENNKINVIVEPFCGSSAFSYYVWLNNKNNNNLSFVLNDNNNLLIELYNISKDMDKFNNLYNDILKILEETTNKEKYLEIVIKSKSDLASWIYVNKIYNIRPGLYPVNNKFTVDSWNCFKNAPIIEFIRNAKITFTNKEAQEIYDLYKNDEKALIFLDPPYLSTNNQWYKNPTFKIYEHLNDNDIDKEKAYIMLCLENIWIIKLLFKNKKIITYDKLYQTSKKKTEHIIIINK